MGKAATPRRRTTKKNGDPTVDYLVALDAKQRFLVSAMNMGWRLAVTFLVPVAVGAWLDRRFDTAPSYTLTGLFLAIVGSAMVVANTVKEVNAETAALDKKVSKKGKRVKSV